MGFEVLESACVLVHTDMMLIGVGSGFRGTSGSRPGSVRITGITRCSGYICTSKLNKATLRARLLQEVLVPTASSSVSRAQF